MTDVTLAPWASRHLPLLVAANTTAATRYVGGPESDKSVQQCHERYLRLSANHEAWMYAIVTNGQSAGGIGFSAVDHDGTLAIPSAGLRSARTNRVGGVAVTSKG